MVFTGICMAEEPPRGSYAIKYVCMCGWMYKCVCVCVWVGAKRIENFN